MKLRLFALAVILVACSEPSTDHNSGPEVTLADTLLVLPFSDSAQSAYAQTAYSLQTYSVKFEDFAQHSAGSTDSMHWPADLKVFGSAQSWNALGADTLDFDGITTVMGLQYSITQAQRAPLQSLEPGKGFDLPEMRLLLQGIDSSGMLTDVLRVIPARATYKTPLIDSSWTWQRTDMLGRIKSLIVRIETPAVLEGQIEARILIDNVATSDDFSPDTNFFSIGLLPDTQKYVEFLDGGLTTDNIYLAQTTWLAQNFSQQRMVFISHLGDIVEHGERRSEWELASQAMAVLDSVEIPYGVMIGNHDFEDEWERPELGSPLFLEYFGTDRFAGKSWFGGTSANGLSNFQLFETPAGNYLYLHLMVDSPGATLAWADSVIKAHPNVPTIITTHAYLRDNGRIPTSYLSGGVDQQWDGISADSVFAGLVAPNEQVFMVTCGHISSEHVQISKNLAGKDVIEMLQDYQNRPTGGEGFLRLLRFYPARAMIEVLTYSPWLQTFEVDANSLLRLQMP